MVERPRIPMLDLARIHAPIRDALTAAIERVMASEAYVMGPEVAAFEAEMARFLGVRHAIGCASGSDGLVIALLALGIGPGDEVITTAFSFFATAGSIARTGATPIFADIDPATFCIDPASIEAKLTSRTEAIVPVHLFGQMADMEPIRAMAIRRGLRVIEDAAQAIGAQASGSMAGTLGDFGALSFYPSKNLGALGDGGMLLTNDDRLAEIARSLREHGSKDRRVHERVGMNSRLDSLQAAVLRVKLPHLGTWTEGRRRAAARYRRLLADVPGIVLPGVRPEAEHTYHQFTLRAAERDALVKKLETEGIGCAVHYPLPLHLQPCFAALGGRAGDCPKAEKAAEEVVSIPVHGELREDEIVRIAQVVRAHAAETSSRG